MTEVKTGDVFTMGYGDYIRVMGTFMSGTEYLPSSPVDVGERVYERLGGQEFERWDDKSAPLPEFIATLQAFLDDTPEGADAEIKFSATGYDDDYNAEYEVGYWRDPTPEERVKREEMNRKIAARDEENAKRAATKEREMYEALKAKFERDA